jgi:hypothetical protein
MYTTAETALTAAMPEETTLGWLRLSTPRSCNRLYRTTAGKSCQQNGAARGKKRNSPARTARTRPAFTAYTARVCITRSARFSISSTASSLCSI